MCVLRRELARTLLRIEERIAMRDVGAAHHAAEDRAQARVGEPLLGEGDEGVMHIVLGYGRGDAIQVSLSQVKEVLSRIIGIRCRVCDFGGWTTKRRRSGNSRLLERTGSVFS